LTRLRTSWNAAEARLRDIGQGGKLEPGGEADKILAELGLVDNGALSDTGNDYYMAQFVLDSDDEVAKALATVLKQQLSVNAFCEKLWGKGDVPVQGGVALLMQIHHSTDEPSAKRWLDLMNRSRLIVYNRASPTIRILYNPSELVTPAEDAERERSKSHVLSPDTPFGNLLALRELIRAARGSIRWYEQHMPPKVLEILHREVDGSNVSELRLLSGPDNVTADAKQEFKRFRTDMAGRGVNAEWRVLTKKGAREIHGRFFISEGLSRNIPPLNTILAGRTDEILQSEVGADEFDAWWARGEDIATFTRAV
jgi:hypothetical protein